MKKKLLCVLLFILGLLCILSLGVAAAYNTKSGTWGDLTWELNTTTGKLIISGEGTMNDFPSSGSTSAWRSYKTMIKSVSIEDDVTGIGSYAFYGCTELTEINFNATAMNNLSYKNHVFSYAGQNGSGITVNIGANVTKIPAYLFYPYSGSDSNNYTPKITNVMFAENSQCTSIGYCAFSDCTGLASVTIPNSVTSIGSFAFSDCTGLASVTIPNSVISIGSFAFSGCSGMTSVTIGNSITSIGSYAFSGCSGLTEINFNATAMNDLSYSDNVFSYASRNESGITVNIGANVTKIPAYLFYTSNYTPKITNVIFAESSQCTSIGSYAFNDCSSLTSIAIPSSVTSIGSYAFNNCSSLTSITIPSSVTNIGSCAFLKCNSLTSLTVQTGNRMYLVMATA